MASVVEISDTRRTIRLPIDEGVIAFRGLSPQRHRFELEYALERGSTANSVLFEAGDDAPAVLVHPPGAAYRDAFLPALAETLPASDAPLLVVVGHINPNRVALLRDLGETYAGLELVVSNAGAKLIDELWNQRKPAPPGEESKQPPLPPRPPLRVIRHEENLPLAQGRSLLLLPAPTPRWPGGLLAFEQTLGLLMSGKFFSAHLCTETWAEANRSSTEEERRPFYDSLMAPMARKVELLVERLEELDIRTIAPAHGPAIDTSWRSLLNDYRRWGESQHQSNLTVLLLFASAYGNTAAIADALGRGVTRTNIRVNCLNCEFTPADELISAI